MLVSKRDHFESLFITSNNNLLGTVQFPIIEKKCLFLHVGRIQERGGQEYRQVLKLVR